MNDRELPVELTSMTLAPQEIADGTARYAGALGSNAGLGRATGGQETCSHCKHLLRNGPEHGQRCRECGTWVRDDMTEHPFFGFKAGCQR